VTGGGAAGYFYAVNVPDSVAKNDILILEKSSGVLSKVKISGGGRCNVTNIISEPAELVNYYPRGKKELLGPFNIFSSSDTIAWFNQRGVKLKTEPDGRVFPVTNDSQTIIDCLLKEADKRKISLLLKHAVDKFEFKNNKWIIHSNEKVFEAEFLVVASGSSKKVWECLKLLGHKIIDPVPSLFTFNINDRLLNGLAGVSVKSVVCSIDGSGISADGPLLITHWGLSGPAILKLSSFAARYLYDKKYKFSVKVNWVPGYKKNEMMDLIIKRRSEHPRKIISGDHLFNIPLRLWERLISKAGIHEEMKWSAVSKTIIESLSDILINTSLKVEGKSTFKEEFVTAGGVDLKEVNFKTMESKLYKNLFFAGEVLDIDAVTGGFNFQAAWTTAWIAAKSAGG
jgi:predicted Rossmann fold flavoprotein